MSITPKIVKNCYKRKIFVKISLLLYFIYVKIQTVRNEKKECIEMPNIKSAKKRVIVNQKKTEQNKAIRSALRTDIKKIELLIKEGKVAEAKANLSSVFASIDSASSKNIIHKNNAANKKARLSRLVYVAEVNAPAEVKVAEVKEEVKAEPVAEVAAEEPVKKTRKPRAKKTETVAE